MTSNVKPITAAWSAAVEEFLTVLAAGGSPKTTRATRRAHLNRVARGLRGSPWSVEAGELVAWCGRQNWATETRRGVRGSLRAFYDWGFAAGYIGSNPAAALPKVRPAEPKPRPASDDAYAAALRAAREPAHRLMLRLAAEAGLRRAEVAHIHTRDFVDDLAGLSLRVHGKGDRDRLVPLSKSVAFELRAVAGTTPGHLFPGRDAGHLSPRWVGKIVAGLLPGDVTMHALRHRFATRAYSVDRDTFAVQTLLGHASPATTRRYVAVPVEGLRSTVEGAA